MVRPSSLHWWPTDTAVRPSGEDKDLPPLPTVNPTGPLPTTTPKSKRAQLLLFYTKYPRFVIAGAISILLLILILGILGGTGHLKPSSETVTQDVGYMGSPLSGSGDGTYYSPSVGVGSCGTLNQDTELVAAINAPQYGVYANPNNSPVCGACLFVTGPKGSVRVKIIDRCPVCKSGDLDLSPAAFDKIADQASGRVHITWKGC